MSEEEIKETSGKRRGRPKKIIDEIPANQEADEHQQDKQIDEEKQMLQDKIVELETKLKEEQEISNELNKEEVEYKKLPAFADEITYPSEIEQAVLDKDKQEAMQGKKLDVRIPETKEDVSFFKKVFKKNKVKKDNMVIVIALHPQGDATVHYIETTPEGTFKYGQSGKEELYHINEHCIYSMKIKRDRLPVCILPTWSMIPLGTKAWFELSQERRGHELERMALKAIKNEERVKLDEGKKGKMSGKTIWIIIAVIIIGYIFLKSTGKI